MSITFINGYALINRGDNISSIISKVEGKLLENYWLSKEIIERVPSSLLEKISKIKAKRIYNMAKERVPAYKKFNGNNNFKTIKETDKQSYVKKYNYEDRCLDGKFPKIGNIDESSGSSGPPTNWIRSLTEEDLLFKAAKFEFFYTYDADKKNYVVLSGWSSGPWATGVKFCEILEHYTLVKNTTADIENIVRSLKTLGKDKDYLIAGYPPFLKNLFDSKTINWKEYKIDVLTGGESTSIEWKRYIKNKLGNKNAKIISSYGASDIDIGIGFETPFTEFVRELAYNNKKLNIELFKTGENPILFQYNPLMHYIENKENGEYTITVLDENTASPKIKYNLHDMGSKVSYKEIIKLLKKHEKEKLKKYLKINKTLKLPFLFVLGRKDGTIAIGGANIYPENVGSAIQSSKHSDKVNRFMIERWMDNKLNSQFRVHVELKKGVKKSEELKKEIEKNTLQRLLKVNLEYAHYINNDETNKENMKPRVLLYDYETEKMFKSQDDKIKNVYIKS